MKPLRIDTLTNAAVKAFWQQEAENARELSWDDDGSPSRMLCSDEQIRELAESVLPSRVEDSHVLRIMDSMRSDGDDLLFEWLSSPVPTNRIKEIDDAEGVSILHLFWFLCRQHIEDHLRWLRNGGAHCSQIALRDAARRARFNSYVAREKAELVECAEGLED